MIKRYIKSKPTANQKNGCKILKGVCVSLKKINPPQYHQTNNTPVSTSTIGCSGKIGSLQYLHFPLRNKKERRGILSYQAIVFLQLSHLERPETHPSPAIERKITTLKKLPMIVPNKNKKVVINKNEIVIM